MSSVRLRARGLTGIALILLFHVPACANRTPPTGEPGCPVMPVDSRLLGDAADLRARIEMRRQAERIGFEVVARANPDELIVIGLSLHGTRLFTVHQRGQQFDVEPTASPMLRHVALWVMDALHRSHWIANTQGVKTGSAQVPDLAGETLRESFDEGQRRREFIRSDSAPAVAGVTIHYAPQSAASPTGRIEIHNEWCGYDASIVILEERAARREGMGSRE